MNALRDDDPPQNALNPFYKSEDIYIALVVNAMIKLYVIASRFLHVLK